jgi:hypothetical protein
MLRVYVPAEPAAFTTTLPASGIVTHDDSSALSLRGISFVEIYFEGNRHAAVNLQRWVDRVHHASGRLLLRAPTVARAMVPRVELLEVGTFDYDEGVVRLEPAHAARCGAWTGEWVTTADPDQLLTSSALRRRGVEAAIQQLASGQPATAAYLRRMFL